MNTLVKNIQCLFLPPRQPPKDGCAHPKKQASNNLQQTVQRTKINQLTRFIYLTHQQMRI